MSQFLEFVRYVLCEKQDINNVLFTEYKTECGGLLTEPSGFIHSPDVDNDGYYDSNQNCFWTITAPAEQVIFLKFLEFDIEFHVDCDYDFVEVCLLSHLARSVYSRTWMARTPLGL